MNEPEITEALYQTTEWTDPCCPYRHGRRRPAIHGFPLPISTKTWMAGLGPRLSRSGFSSIGAPVELD